MPRSWRDRGERLRGLHRVPSGSLLFVPGRKRPHRADAGVPGSSLAGRPVVGAIDFRSRDTFSHASDRDAATEKIDAALGLIFNRAATVTNNPPFPGVRHEIEKLAADRAEFGLGSFFQRLFGIE